MKTKQYFSAIIWIASLILIGSIIGSSTKYSVGTWYAQLQRSPLSPPNYVFGIAWTILYTMIAISGWIIWKQEGLKNLPNIKTLYIIQLILNWSWTPLFFTYQMIGAAFLCICLIIALVATIIFKSYTNLKIVSIFLTPYLLWLIFASHLNLYIWLYN